MKKLILLTKTLLAVALLCVGQNAWGGEIITLYERGTTNAWAAADLEDWTAAWCTPAIDGGLKVTTKNGGWTCTKAISTTANSIVTLTATIRTGGAPGRSGSYDYIKIGGVEARFNEQDKVASIAIDGVASTLSLTYNRATDYNVEITIDQSNGSVSYTVGSVSSTSTSFTAITDVVFGHNKAGNEGYEINPVLKKIDVSEELQDIETADYTINYKDGETTVKTVSGTGIAVGTEIPVLSSFWVSTTKYVKDGGEPSSLTVAKGGSVLNVSVSEAPTYSYTVNATDGTNVLKVLTSGYTYSGETVNVPFPRYINVSGTLYEKSAVNKEFRQDVVILSDAQVENFVYSATGITNVVYYSEGEEISGATSTDAGNNMKTRSSNAHCGYAESDIALTTLPAGKYTAKMVVYSNSSGGATLNFNYDDAYDAVVSGANNWAEITYEFTLTDSKEVQWLTSGTNKNGLDLIYIQKTGDVATIGSTGWTTFASAYPLDLSKMTASEGEVAAYYASAVGGGNVTMTSTASDAVAAGTGIMLKGTDGATITIPVAASAGTAISGNKLVGCTAETVLSANANYYVLVNNEGAEFQCLDEKGATIPAGKAYLNIGVGGSARALRITFDDITGVNQVEAASEAKAKEGKFIENGKLVIVKNGQKYNAAGAQVK